ncbi:MAG: GAF and ANTAR domain-containing protein [Ilumatobacteraceae bacterium]
MERETLLLDTLVGLADNLVDDFDIVELLTLLSYRCVEALDVTAAGIMLASPTGELRVIASSSETMRILELFEQQTAEGPCQDCYRTGELVVDVSLTETTTRWPRFTPRATHAGFQFVSALPMHLRDQTLGALNLFRAADTPLLAADVRAAQALADVATIAILQHRVASATHVVNDQLQGALNSRLVIEQAKGMLSERGGVTLDDAFGQLRRYARNHNRRLADICNDFIHGTIATASLNTQT